MTDRLELSERHLERREPRAFMEFVVNGQDLRELIAASYADFNVATDLVSAFVLNWPIGFPLDDFNWVAGLSTPPLPFGRTPLYSCAECGDIGCGAVTAVIEALDDRVVWRDLGYENGYEALDHDSMFTGVGPFVFTRDNYDAVLNQFKLRWPDQA